MGGDWKRIESPEPGLVITLKLGHLMSVGDANVQFIATRGNYIRLKIVAPKEITIKSHKNIKKELQRV